MRKRLNSKPRFTLEKGKRWYILAIPVGLFIMGSVFQAIETAALGAEVAKLEKEEVILTDENRDLSAGITDNSSLASIDKKASESGYVKVANVLYLNQETGIAKLP